MANAAAKIWGTSSARTTEDNALFASGVLTVNDPDPGQSFMKAVVDTRSKYGTWSVDENGTWNYLLNTGSVAIQQLADGKTLTDTFTVTSLDGSARKTVT